MYSVLFILRLMIALILLSVINVSGQQESGSFTPDWAQQVVWYQIFPERFCNGDPSNDPTVSDIQGADPTDPAKEWQIHPWGSDWFRLQPYELANGEPELWKHMQRRRYGGDLQGILDKLDYLRDLGITAIYLNPVFDAPSMHKYDGASYHHIDPNFGPDPAGDRKLMALEDPLDPETWVWTQADELALRLIDEAHRRGMRIIFDGVFNHMGRNSFAFRDVVINQERSRYKDWFTIHSWDDPAKGTEFRYEGWFGAASLPELREDSTGIVPGPRAYIFAATERWMNPKGLGASRGIDGWRLDVAFCVGHPFWKDWRKHVKAINPEAYLTAEIVDRPEKVIPYMLGDEFDGEMSYNFAFACAEFFFDPPPNRISAAEFDRRLATLRNLYPPGVAEVCMNLGGSHDVNRLASYIVNRGIGLFRDWDTYARISQAAYNPAYLVRKPTAYERSLQRLFVIFQMTYKGAPMVYYGDEAGMWGGNDPDCRKPMLWEDIAYEAETFLPDGKRRDPDPVAFDRSLHEHYRKLIRIRNAHPALRNGSYKTIHTDSDTGLFVFERRDGDEHIVVLLNNSDAPVSARIPELQKHVWTDLLNDHELWEEQDSRPLTVAPRWARILRARP